MTTNRYRKRPVETEVIQFTGDNVQQIWDMFGADGIYGPTEKNPDYLILTTVHGDEAPARVGDWVIPDEEPGTFYPCKPDIFERTYEPAAVQPPTVTPAALREAARLVSAYIGNPVDTAQILEQHCVPEDVIDGVLAQELAAQQLRAHNVQPSVRAGLFRKAADVAAHWNSDCQNCATELEVRDELRRMADEEQPAIDRAAVMPPVGGMKSNPFNYHPEDDPAADRAELRDRIAQAARTVPLRLGPNAIAMAQRGEPIILSGTEADNLADAVLAARPAPTDRAAVLREAADRYEEFLAKANTEQDPRYWTAVRDITLGLRGMANEEHPATDRTATERLARIREWMTSDVVTARTEFGNGYREAQRDIHDLLDGQPLGDEEQPASDTEAASVAQPGKENQS